MSGRCHPAGLKEEPSGLGTHSEKIICRWEAVLQILEPKSCLLYGQISEVKDRKMKRS